MQKIYMGNCLDQKNISFHQVIKEDCRKLWQWRNEKVVRDQSFSSDPIPYPIHQKWFNKRLVDADCVFLKILSNKVEAGVLRFDINDQSAEIHITIASEMRNRGIGTQSIRLGSEFLFKQTNVDVISAHIKTNNNPSIRTFEKAGFIVSRRMTFKESDTLEMLLCRDRAILKKHYPIKIGAVVQARMGSERLPGKSLADVGGKPLIQHIIENLKTSRYLSHVVLATSENDQDKILLDLAESLKVYGFAGSENDVLNRYRKAAQFYSLDIVVRVTGDNILIDIEGMDRTIALYLTDDPAVAVNGGKNGYPLGTAVEVLSTALLRELDQNVNFPEEREHVTLHLYKHKDKYVVSHLKAPDNYKDMDVRLTVDTPEDLGLIRQLYEKLKERNEDFKLSFVSKYLRQHQELKMINSHVKQRIF